MNFLWFVICYLLGVEIKGFLGYIGCIDIFFNYQGYIYIIDLIIQQKVWLYCGFFNFSFDYVFCGLIYISGEYFFCDLDGFLLLQFESKKMLYIKYMLFS